MKKLWIGVFGRKMKEVPIEKPSSGFQWANHIEFIFFPYPSENTLRNHLLAELGNYEIDRILVVGGWSKLWNDIGTQGVPGYNIHVNKDCSLKWLCETCKQIRHSSSREIIVTNFPRKSNPPRVRYTLVPGGFISKADNKFPGSTVDVVLKDASLSLLGKDVPSMKMAVFFVGIYAKSYYFSVISSQDHWTSSIVTSKVLVHSNDPYLRTSDHARLSECRSVACRSILIEVSENIEQAVQTGKLHPECPAYSGGVLGP